MTKTSSVNRVGSCFFHGILEAFETLYWVFILAVFVAIRAPADLRFLLPEHIHWKLGLFFR